MKKLKKVSPFYSHGFFWGAASNFFYTQIYNNKGQIGWVVPKYNNNIKSIM